MSKLAKALYDNTAECPEELAFHKGDILTVVEENVSDTSGWWMCSIYGRQGLAPANRLKLLQQTPEKPNIYQIPNTSRVSSSNPGHDDQQSWNIYEVPSTLSSSCNIPRSAASNQNALDENKPLLFSVKPEVYDVPNQPTKDSPITASSLPTLSREHPSIPVSQFKKRFDSNGSDRCRSLEAGTLTCAVPPSQHQYPNYDIPVPSAMEAREKKPDSYSTLPIPSKNEWIYDVPTSQSHEKLPCNRVQSLRRFERIISPQSSLYDIPKPNMTESPSPPKVLPRVPVRNKSPSPITENVDAPKEEAPSDFPRNHLSDHIPLECRRDSGNSHDLTRVHMYRAKSIHSCSPIQNSENRRLSLTNENMKHGRSQRISTASNSSTSSCDSLQMSSAEPQQVVTLSQEEACRTLSELQESVSRAVPKLMDFVSSRWRCRTHLEQHLEEIKTAAEVIADSLTQFLNFALDIKGNAQRLTDSHLKTRLCKQLSIVEDSSVILKQTVNCLNIAGWPLDTLCQDPSQLQTPDQLERFVMVARTVPDDVKRLVSIVNANGKLLFKASPKDPDVENPNSVQEIKKSSDLSQVRGEQEEEDNDYVELQTKTDCENQEKEVHKEKDALPTSKKVECSGDKEEFRSVTQSEHCRLYFGALQKALGGFVSSLRDGQPPENFISHSKLVIMVGQRLVDTLCREAQRQGSSQVLLCKSNHLCALLKQLAVATKKAALHFPDKQALLEAQEFAQDLAQKAQHFRVSLDI
ncbi:cas scaffolding protein family member 4 [Synchiropus splendidus]|uniref:cas scaffolding protein family member 4 n=1 Tax=Synchiropus splendidus TaxID=270530 RepID=UPI00237DA183|nr:cas scaffolding protein family member 4 [Synchiropus splendidus]